MGRFFFLHHHLFSFFSLRRGKSAFRYISPWSGGRKGRSTIEDKAHQYISWSQGRMGANFYEHSSAWGVLKLSRHPIITPPLLSWFFPFSSFFPFWDPLPPTFPPLLKWSRAGGGVGRWMVRAGGYNYGRWKVIIFGRQGRAAFIYIFKLSMI